MKTDIEIAASEAWINLEETPTIEGHDCDEALFKYAFKQGASLFEEKLKAERNDVLFMDRKVAIAIELLTELAHYEIEEKDFYRYRTEFIFMVQKAREAIKRIGEL